MKSLQELVPSVTEAAATQELADAVAERLDPSPSKSTPRSRGRSNDGLVRIVLARLPLAVAVIDAEATLLYWNEQAAVLLGAPPLFAEERPGLERMLAGAGSLQPPQRERLMQFARAHIAAGDRAEPDACLRLSTGRNGRLGIEIHGLGAGRWMLVLDDGRATASGGRGAPAKGDAWLDPLTGLSNRRHFNETLRETLDVAAADARQAILLIDLDRFGPVNEVFGPQVGDALLCLAAQRLRRETRDDDLLARLGGDEFVILVPNGTTAEALAERVVAIVAQPFLVEGRLVSVTASVGIVRFPDHGGSADDLMHHVALALYEAKSAGGRTWRVFDAAVAPATRARQALEADFRKAAALHEFSLVCHPRRDLASTALTGFAVGMQWTHPVHGVVPSDVVAKLAAATGSALALAEWELQAACAQAADWPAELAVGVRIQAPEWLASDRLAQAVEQALSSSGLAAERLELLVPETMLWGRPVADARPLHRLHSLGARVTLVDFTLGPMLPQHLRSFPFHGVAFGTDPLSKGAGEKERTVLRGALVATGLTRIGCIDRDAPISATEAADIARLHAATGWRDPVSEHGCGRQR